jgi:two-component system, OmpR family, sensor kinase
MRGGWAGLGLRGRLALSIGAIVIAAFAVVFVVVRYEMNDESAVIRREEGREMAMPFRAGDRGDRSAVSPIEDAQDEVERTFLVAGGIALVTALLAGYMVAARTAAPLRHLAATAAAVDAGDLTPRLGPQPGAAIEVRTLADAFDHMLDRLDLAFARQRRFVADASHELRTPLTAIRGQLEVLAREERPGAEDVRRVEATVRAEMRRLERLVDDLLALARLEEGVGPALREVEVGPFLRELAGAVPGVADLGPVPAGAARLDPDLIAQVVRNLLVNARRHAGPGGRVILSAEAAGGMLTVMVDDDGPGVPAAERERVFDRFQRSQAARDRASGGSGLGLAIARAIVTVHGGRIWIEDSPLLGGARAAFELPGHRAGN